MAASAYLHAVQSEHTPAPVAPVVVEYLPVAQSPAQMAAEVAPVAAEYVPAAQSKQNVVPITPENLPATQAEHTDIPAVSVNLPARHSTHVATDEAPMAAECLPAAQLLAHYSELHTREYYVINICKRSLG